MSDELQRRGYEGVRIFHRLSVPRQKDGMVVTNPVTFLDA